MTNAATAFYTGLNITIIFESQYHVGSGLGWGRLIDSLLTVDGDGVPVLPGTTVSGNVAQALFDLLRFSYFGGERRKLCPFHHPSGSSGKARLSCKLLGKSLEECCLLCYFFGSPAQEGLLDWQDFGCATDAALLRPMLKSKQYHMAEREQYIKPYSSHRRNLRTGTVLEKHLWSAEEGAELVFTGEVVFKAPVPLERAKYLAAALLNTRALGRRKSRGKGQVWLEGTFRGLPPAASLDFNGFFPSL